MIVDASVVFKWFADEEGSEEALALISADKLFAPTLLLSEVGNALWKKARLAQIDPAVSFEADLQRIPAIVSLLDERDCAARALTMARSLDHPIYDCIYLAMAEMDNRPLITADRRFLNKVGTSVWAGMVETLI